ncbi:hypothetical protein SteCoe_36197 [Stentor coeruleus]|uniref:SGS domain-containing protein n=1 Tax=Stentor coeruleus TaxID=5963 RepID=A0A1R2AQN9_9CILI|nr:hypothetical protein SteCoe_36197 [Stentor coeruleus]
MESLNKAHSLFVADMYNDAEPLYEEASKIPETAAEALTSLAYINIKQGRFGSAIAQSEQAIQINPSNYLPYLRKAQALFYDQHFSAAQELFLHCNSLKPSSASSWIQKCESELKHSMTKEIYTWFQSNQDVHLIFFVKTNSTEDVKLEINSDMVNIKAKTVTGSEFLSSVKLSMNIDPVRSKFTVMPNKVEVVLKKVEIVNWHTLEPVKAQEIRPSYPSSSKKPKDWSKIDRELEEELKKEKPEGEAALNELFKQIYENSDEDTRRAMIKSYQTSGGTVLSTDWKEVNKKDYEGKDRPDPPKGQEWAKPN